MPPRLSKFFDGKSQSFASLAAVGSLEDLPKPAQKRLKTSRNCGGDIDAHGSRRLSPRRLCTKPAASSGVIKKAVVRTEALSVLAAITPTTEDAAAPSGPSVVRPEGVAAKALIVT